MMVNGWGQADKCRSTAAQRQKMLDADQRPVFD